MGGAGFIGSNLFEVLLKRENIESFLSNPNFTLIEGDIPQSLASTDKVCKLLGYNPTFSMQKGLKEAVKWYWENL